MTMDTIVDLWVRLENKIDMSEYMQGSVTENESLSMWPSINFAILYACIRNGCCYFLAKSNEH